MIECECRTVVVRGKGGQNLVCPEFCTTTKSIELHHSLSFIRGSIQQFGKNVMPYLSQSIDHITGNQCQITAPVASIQASEHGPPRSHQHFAGK